MKQYEADRLRSIKQKYKRKYKEIKEVRKVFHHLEETLKVKRHSLLFRILILFLEKNEFF